MTLPASPSNRAPHLSEGDDNGCLTTPTGLAFCWGDNDALALGNANPEATNSTSPTAVLCLP